METSEAIRIINTVRYKPGWQMEPEDYTRRLENGVLVHVTYGAHDTAPEVAQRGYPEDDFYPEMRANFTLMVGRIESEEELLHAVLCSLLKIEEHESREFLKYKVDCESPFHPHTDAGIRMWHELNNKRTPDYYLADVLFGK